MDNDNVYQPRGGIMPEPVSQANEREDEVSRTLSQLPILKDELDHLNTRIAFYESVYSVPAEVRTNPEEFMHIIAANTLTAENLIKERNDLIGRIKEASKE